MRVHSTDDKVYGLQNDIRGESLDTMSVLQ